MATLTFSSHIWHGFAVIFTSTAKSHNTEAAPKRSTEHRRAEQDLIKEMMWSNPEAFQSEQDAHYMLQGFCGRY
jgi:hypothetical protein